MMMSKRYHSALKRSEQELGNWLDWVQYFVIGVGSVFGDSCYLYQATYTRRNVDGS